MNIGAIFDWDGVVANSEIPHLESWRMLAKAHGHEIPENFMLDSFGKRNLEIIPNILGWTDDTAEVLKLSDEKEVYYRAIIAEKGLPLIPGAEAFLRALGEAGIPCAIGSSSPRSNLDQALDVLGFAPLFSAVVSMEDVPRGKPAPDVFLLAAEKMGVDPRRCAVFEDSEAGIDAANAAKMKSVAVATTRSADFWESRWQGFPDAIIADFLPMTPEILASFWRK